MSENELASIVVRSWNRQCEEVTTFSPFDEYLPNGLGPVPSYTIYFPLEPAVRLKVVTIPIKTGKNFISVKSWFFTPPLEENLPVKQKPILPEAEGDSPEENATSISIQSPETDSVVTRIVVPKDAIKVEDRLGYILQPPLEVLLGRNTLEMPFEPFNYQKQGIGFLYSAHFAILADEMGLGKTMQAITTLRLLLRTGECRRVLLVCPKPLVTNWKREFELWAPEIPVHVIEGKGAKRQWLWQEDAAPVRIANYELLQRDREYFDSGTRLVSPKFDLVILDESQRIKNKSSVTSEAARAIPRYRSWALTGTPVENSAEDLVGIFEFLSPGYLASGLKPTRISQLVGTHILRRTKEMVMTDLPPKMIRDTPIELQGEQEESYRLAFEEGELRLNEMGDSVTLHHAFELIARLKQICNFDPVTGESAKAERLLADLEEIAQSGRKAILFSQWVETLLMIKERIKHFHPLEYHGRIPQKQRESVIKRFREDPNSSVILMSYGAGSVGLNLQFCQYVFLFDRWWNPAVEDQAINRAHRIGVTGPVTVTRFVTLGTIEEKIDRILQEKRNLSEAILSGAQGLNLSKGLSQEDIFSLFNLRKK